MAKSLGTQSSLYISCKNSGTGIIEVGDAVYTLHTKNINSALDTYIDCDVVTQSDASDAAKFLGVAAKRAYAGDYFEAAFFGVVLAKVSTAVAGKDILVPGIGADGMFGKPTVGVIETPIVGFSFDVGAWTTANKILTYIYLNGITVAGLGL